MSKTYEPIATTTLGSDSANVTFSTISGTYTDLILVSHARSARAAGDDTFRAQVNSDTASNYSSTNVRGDGSTAITSRATSVTSVILGQNIEANTATANVYSVVISHFMNYANSTTNKTIISRNSAATKETGAQVGLWRSTSAITSIKVFAQTGNLKSGSTFTLYGIKAE